MNNKIPDLVRDSELETRFHPDCNTETIHTYHERSPYSRGLVSRSEHWQRIRKVGGGGFGSVWLERCTNGGRRDNELRAVKQLEITPQFTQSEYNRELEAIAKFSQRKYARCFVRSFGWYRSLEHLFISMEYLELGDLHRYLQKNPPLPEAEAKEITYQILDGLSMMHSNDFTHRDLKLNNILLKSCPPNSWWIKIADFGISKRVEDGLGVPTTTKGTAGYMAPELLGFTERGRPYATDIWAIGEIAFQMLTKKPTFKNPGLLAKYVDHPDLFPVGLLQTARTSQSGIEFILSTMRPVPDQRLAAEDALNHTWMDQTLTTPAAPTTDEGSHGPSISPDESEDEEFATWDTAATIGRSKSATAIRESRKSDGNTTDGRSASCVTAVALHSFEALADGEISFPKGATITDVVSEPPTQPRISDGRSG
ncbi:kinase-like domain-containing protein [Aspergillus ambiguus]|uniref:kinase-like domain-containing protein n=1 Tax=Aspergillus ambiguus TaxID=176160 RepID=UPI003CCDD71D